MTLLLLFQVYFDVSYFSGSIEFFLSFLHDFLSMSKDDSDNFARRVARLKGDAKITERQDACLPMKRGVPIDFNNLEQTVTRNSHGVSSVSFRVHQR